MYSFYVISGYFYDNIFGISGFFLDLFGEKGIFAHWFLIFCHARKKVYYSP